MNNDEKIISEQEELVDTPKGLSKGALIGIIGGAAALVVAIAVVLIILLSGNKCTHIDANDDYLCDNCGEHFDDGDEPNVPENDAMSVTFEVHLDDGSSLSGIKFSLVRGDVKYDLVSGADGRASTALPAGTYAVEYDEETMPEYCWGETYGVKVEEGKSIYTIVVVDNRPNGTEEKPFPTTDEFTEVTVDAGAEIFYSYRGTSATFILIKDSNLVVYYSGNVYTAINGEILVELAPNEIGQITLFSIKNNTSNPITASVEMFGRPGTSDNPFVLDGNGATATVGKDQTVYYTWTADKDGVLVLVSPTVGNDIVITRSYVMIIDGEEVPIPITSGTGGGMYAYSYVSAGDVIEIGVSYVTTDADGNISDDDVTHDVEFSIYTYEGTESDPIPVYDDEIYLSVDAGAELVFAIANGETIEISTDDSITVTNNGAEIIQNNGVYSIIGDENTLVKISNNSDNFARLALERK